MDGQYQFEKVRMLRISMGGGHSKGGGMSSGMGGVGAG